MGFIDGHFAATSRFFYDETRGAYLISRIAVMKEYRGKGLGAEIVKAAEKANKEVAAAPAESTADISKLTVAELKEMAKANGIENYTSMKKEELIAALNN